MKKINAILSVLIIFVGLGFASLAHADNDKHDRERKEIKAVGSTLEVHINDNGKVLVRGAKVTSVSGTTINAVTSWGNSQITWAVNTGSATELNRRFGGKLNLSEISVGDYLSFTGDIVTTTGGFTVNAKVVKNWSIQKAKNSFFGAVSSIDSGNQSFMLATGTSAGTINVRVLSGTQIKKNDSTIAFADIKAGDKVSVSGLYNNLTKVLEADKVKIYVEKTTTQTIFEGKLKSISGGTLPVAMVVTLNNGTDVTVNVPVGISIVNRSYLSTSIGNFAVNDSIRIYGSREGNVVDATIIRNTSLPR